MTIEQMDLLQSKLKSASEASHIWWGVNAENRKHGIPRVDHLRQAPARVRFLSAEPLLEDLGPISSGAVRSRIRFRLSQHGAALPARSERNLPELSKSARQPFIA
jgi:protein gp37